MDRNRTGPTISWFHTGHEGGRHLHAIGYLSNPRSEAVASAAAGCASHVTSSGGRSTTNASESSRDLKVHAHSDLRNGQTGTITTINPDTRTVTFLRDIDGVVVELPGSYVDSSFDHAYAQTIHTAQGQTFGTTHLYVDAGVAAEHGYTALSRARDETHLWVNTGRGVDGRCAQPGQSAFEAPVESLVRPLSRSVVQPPALAQGLAVEDVTDQQPHQSLQNLETRFSS